MSDVELIVENGKLPANKAGEIGCVMTLHASAIQMDEEIQWFEYKPTYYGEKIKIAWNKDNMHVVLPPNMAEVLFKHNWARPMKDSEAWAYNTKIGEIEQKESTT